MSTEGTVDGGVYRFNARHFEWLVKVGEAVGLGFDDLGKRKFGREETLFFCDELSRIYGSDDPDIAEGASFAVEHWAAAGFWKQLITGLDAFKNREAPDLRLAFFTWHDRVEDQHAAHTMDELEGAFQRPGLRPAEVPRGRGRDAQRREDVLGRPREAPQGAGAHRRVSNALETPVEIGTPVLEGTDHVELWVGNARQAAYHYRNAFGFDVIAYAGPETGVRDRASYVLQQGKVRLVLTAPLQPEGAIAEHVRLHGDGVRAIALRVEDARAAYEAATSRGARSVGEPTTVTDSDGAITFASVATFGDTVHHFVERNEYSGAHWPGYREERAAAGGVGLRFIDHTVGNVELGKMDDWVTFYSEVFGFNVFQEFDEHDIATQYSALRSKVARDPRSMVTFPINEPAVGHQGLADPGVPRLLPRAAACSTSPCTPTTSSAPSAPMRDRGVEFLSAPHSYYEALGERAAGIDEDLERLEDLSVLIDRDDDGYLLQIFTRPVGDRPTLFFEVIQRKGCKGFGKGNFKALFEAIEREQAARGNL